MARLVLILSLVLAAFPSASLAERADSRAPAGAPPDWLPAKEWVMERWMPFETAALEREYGMNRTDLYFYVRDAGDGDRTLLDLARMRGLPSRGLAARLLASRRRALSEREWNVMHARATLVLSQGHLAEHMLGHVFHHWAIWNDAQGVFGVSQTRLHALEHRAPAEIAADGGLNAAQLRARVLRALERTGRRGVATRQLPGREAAAMRAMLLAAVDRWSTTRPDRGKAAARPRGALCTVQVR